MENVLTDVRAGLIALIALIDGAPAPAPEPTPAPAEFVVLPVTYQLFGPVQANGAMSQVPGATFAFQGNALTASTKTFYTGAPMAEIESARAVAVWAPGSTSNEIEIVKFDDGPTNIEQIGLMIGQNVSSPVVSGVDITAGLRNLSGSSSPRKHIGFRMKGPASYTMYDLRVEVAWRIPTPAQ